MFKNMSEWASAGAKASEAIDLSSWTNAEIGAALKTHKMGISESFATAEAISTATLKSASLDELLREYKARLLVDKAMTGVQQVFVKNAVLSVMPGDLNVIVKEETTKVPTHGVGYFSMKPEESISYAAAGAVIARTYGKKGHVIVTSSLSMPPLVREDFKDTGNLVQQNLYKCVVGSNDAFVQRDKMAQFFLSNGGFFPVNALFSSLKIGSFIPVRKASDNIMQFYKQQGIPGTSMYSLCAPPRYETHKDATLTTAIFFRAQSRKIRGEDNTQIASLCAPSYIGEFPRNLQASLTTAFALMMIIRTVEGDSAGRIIDMTSYKCSSEVSKFISSNFPVFDENADAPYKGDKPGFFHVPTDADPTRRITILKSNHEESTVSKTIVRDPNDINRTIGLYVAQMERRPGIVLIDVFAYLHLYDRKDIVILPHPIGHRCRVFIASANRLKMNSVTQQEMSDYLIYCNMWRTLYPFHRRPMWATKEGLRYFVPPHPIIIRRNVGKRDVALFDIGIIAQESEIDDANHEEMLRGMPTKFPETTALIEVAVIEPQSSVSAQYDEPTEDDGGEGTVDDQAATTALFNNMCSNEYTDNNEDS